jgi:hypothetical protein
VALNCSDNADRYTFLNTENWRCMSMHETTGHFIRTLFMYDLYGEYIGMQPLYKIAISGRGA